MAYNCSTWFHTLMVVVLTLCPKAETFVVLPLLPQLAAGYSSERLQSQSSFPGEAAITNDGDDDDDGTSSSSCSSSSSSSSSPSPSPSPPLCSPKSRVIVDRSTLTLLEHVNLNVPSHEHILPFYFELLGCGMDPRKAANLAPDAPKKTLWANCGASQFHLPFGETAQRIPGEVGLRFDDDSLKSLQRRLELPHLRSSYATAESGKDPRSGRDYIRIIDHYGNIFVCRATSSGDSPSTLEEGGCEDIVGSSTKLDDLRQPIIKHNEREEWGDEIVTKYGRLETECRGIDYVEFSCPKGTARKIALFYESVLDATTAVVDAGNGFNIAIVAVGNVDQDGRADQSLLFRETAAPIPEYDGHHIALYVGETQADFEQAFKNALLIGVVWKNPRFSDQVDSLAEAQKEKQFRFKDILDMETGELIMQLEHELRSIQHPAWPGRKES